MMQTVEQRRAADRERQRRWREANRAAVKERNRERYAEDPQMTLGRIARYADRLHSEIFMHYGLVCTCCGSDQDLTIDHVDGRGGDHRESLYGNRRKGGGVRFYRWLRTHDYPAGFQSLCRRCNVSKGIYQQCMLRHL